MKADSVGSEGAEPIPNTALLHRGGLPKTIQLSHRSELGSEESCPQMVLSAMEQMMRRST
jgi:hypothetical protein